MSFGIGAGEAAGAFEPVPKQVFASATLTPGDAEHCNGGPPVAQFPHLGFAILRRGLSQCGFRIELHASQRLGMCSGLSGVW
jgi:hypothetical protein